MKNILIVSDYFAPQNNVGAIRITKIAKFLSKKGHSVKVLRSIRSSDNNLVDPILLNDIKYINNISDVRGNRLIIRIRQRLDMIGKRKVTLKSKNVNDYQKKNGSQNYIKLLRLIFRIFLNIFYVIEAYSLSLKYRKVIIKKFEQGERYDVVLTTFSTMSGHMTAYYMKKKYNLRWIADFRDPMDNSTVKDLISTKIHRMLQKKFIKNADIITCVSEGLRQHLVCSSKINYANKIYVITNGYDDEDMSLLLKTDTEIDQSKLNFIYSGSMYEGQRNLKPLFEVIQDIINSNIISSKDIKLHYLGNDGCEFKKQAGVLFENVIDYGKVDRKKSLEFQRTSDFIIVSTWNDNQSSAQGVIPIKFYEALMLRKNIILLVSGDKQNSELSGMVKDTGSGVVFEKTKSNFKDMEKTIIKSWDDKKMGILDCDFIIDKNKISKYSWEELISKFEVLL